MKGELFNEYLQRILASADPELYPDTRREAQWWLDEVGPEDEVAMEPVGDFFDADPTQVMLPAAAELVRLLLEDAIAGGNGDAACDLGSLYYTGRIGEQSYPKAMALYEKAAGAGCRQAQENLGYCWYYGRCGTVDYEKAFHYFALGAFDGHIRSLYKIGDMYRNGYYVEQNSKEAFAIYERCLDTMTEAALPLVGADVCMRMGDCLSEGIGTEADPLRALEYYQKSEGYFYRRLREGDHLIRGCYERVIRRQQELREKLQLALPDLGWAD